MKIHLTMLLLINYNKIGFPNNNNNSYMMKINGLTDKIDKREFTILFVAKYKMLD